MKTICTLIIGLIALSSCSTALHRSIPKGEKHKRIVQKNEKLVGGDELDLSENQPIDSEHSAPNNLDIETPSSPQQWGILTKEISTAAEESNVTALNSKSVHFQDDSLQVIPQEVVELAEKQVKQSEKLSKLNFGFSIAFTISILFSFLFLIGLIGYIITLLKYNKLIYVSEDAENRMKSSKRIFLIASILMGVILLLFLALLILLF